jgi:predicted CopG family antitoxin
MGRQISVSEDVYSELVSLKVHPREPFNDVIRRLLRLYKAQHGRPEKKVEQIEIAEGGDVGHQMEEAGTVVTKEEHRPEPTGEGKEEPKGEEVTTSTPEPLKPEFPKTEVPLAGVPSSEKPKEPPVDFSWAKKIGKFDDLVRRWEAMFGKWSTESLVETFRRCLDYPTRRAVINIFVARFNEKLPETERATIWNFLNDEDVKKWLNENKLIIMVEESGETKKMILKEIPEEPEKKEG